MQRSLAVDGGKSSSDAAAGGGSPSVCGRSIEGSDHGAHSPDVGHLSLDMVDINMESTRTNDWGVFIKEFDETVQEPVGWSTTAKHWGHSEESRRQGCGTDDESEKRTGNYWPLANDSRRPDGRDNSRSELSNQGLGSAYMAPPLQHSCQFSSQLRSEEETISNVLPQDHSDVEYDSEPNGLPHPPDNASDDDDNLVKDSDDDLSDDYDSDSSQKSREMRNKNKWFKAFFEAMDSLTYEERNEQTRRWHCPACHDGPGAIKYYKGLQPLLAHAKTKGSIRVKLHRVLAVLLEEELQKKGTLAIPSGEEFDKWKGLREPITDHEIVWPPMVVISNPLIKKDDDNKWLAMGTQELLEYFSEFAAVKARHSYGPNGHQGVSVLIFETSALGYWEAAHLHNHFVTNGKGRDAWELRQNWFDPGVKRQLYGYLACKEDIDIFNQHSKGKSMLKFQMRSYQQMVVLPMKQMRKDNQTMVSLKKKIVKQEQHLKFLEETVIVVNQKLHGRIKQDRIGELRTNIQHAEYKKGMDYVEQLSKDQIDGVYKTIEKLPEEHAKAKLSNADYETNEEQRQSKGEKLRSVESQVIGDDHFESERVKLMHAHGAGEVEIERKHPTDELELLDYITT